MLPKLGPRRRFVGYLQEQKQLAEEERRKAEEAARKAAEPQPIAETKIVPYIDPEIFGPLPDFGEEAETVSAAVRVILSADLERASQV